MVRILKCDSARRQRSPIFVLLHFILSHPHHPRRGGVKMYKTLKISNFICFLKQKMCKIIEYQKYDLIAIFFILFPLGKGVVLLMSKCASSNPEIIMPSLIEICLVDLYFYSKVWLKIIFSNNTH